jgi:hypothetical protein
MWHMNGHPVWTPTDWRLHLNDTGRADMTHFARLFNSRAWADLVPDLDNTLVTGNKGSGDAYAAAAITTDGVTAMVYFPFSKTVTVNMALIRGTNVNAWWFNLRDGTAQFAGLAPSTGSRQFSPPTNSDWLLVLDDAAANLAAPGQSVVPTALTTAGPSTVGQSWQPWFLFLLFSLLGVSALPLFRRRLS